MIMSREMTDFKMMMMVRIETLAREIIMGILEIEGKEEENSEVI